MPMSTIWEAPDVQTISQPPGRTDGLAGRSEMREISTGRRKMSRGAREIHGARLKMRGDIDWSDRAGNFSYANAEKSLLDCARGHS